MKLAYVSHNSVQSSGRAPSGGGNGSGGSSCPPHVWARLSDSDTVTDRIKMLEAMVSGIPVLAHPEVLNQLEEGLRSSHLIRCCDSIEKWGAEILGESPFQWRKNIREFQHLDPILKKLDGCQVYQFLQNSEELR